MGAIDIGVAAINRGSSHQHSYTILNLGNPANALGTITSVQLYFNSTSDNATGVKVGTFYGSGTLWTGRDYATIGNVTKGSTQTFSGLDIDVETDDVIGTYFTAGYIERDLSGGSGLMYQTDDKFGLGVQTYLEHSGDIISLYGTGETPPPAAPTVTTQAATIIVPGGATLNGNITADGYAAITQHGFCWKSGADPVNIGGADGYSELGAGAEGAFDQAKTGLAEATEFYYRAYATNSEDTSYGAAQSWTTGQTHSGVVAIAPDIGITVEGNRLADGACPIGVAVAQTAIGNRLADAACPIAPAVGVEAIANALWSSAEVAIEPELGLSLIANALWNSASSAISIEMVLSLDPNIYTLAAMAMTPGAGVSAAANVIRGGVTAIAPAVALLLDASHLASAAVAITPDANVETIGNYFTCAVAAIAIAVSQSALCTKVVHGAVAITVDTSVAATAIRYLLTIIGYSGEFGAGSVLEINSDKMTFILDGVNAIKDIVGSFANVPPGDSTVTYEDDEGTRDVTLDLEYTPRDA